MTDWDYSEMLFSMSDTIFFRFVLFWQSCLPSQHWDGAVLSLVWIKLKKAKKIPLSSNRLFDAICNWTLQDAMIGKWFSYLSHSWWYRWYSLERTLGSISLSQMRTCQINMCICETKLPAFDKNLLAVSDNSLQMFDKKNCKWLHESSTIVGLTFPSIVCTTSYHSRHLG